jgi:hypothetical protein
MSLVTVELSNEFPNIEKFPENFYNNPFTFEKIICSDFEPKLRFFISGSIIVKNKIDLNFLDEFQLYKEENGYHYYLRNSEKKVYIYYKSWYSNFHFTVINYLQTIPKSIYESDPNKAEIHIILFPGPINPVKKNIQITGEHTLSDPSKYLYNFSFRNNLLSNEICYPYFCQVIDTYKKYEKLFDYNENLHISEKFCSFIHSNGSCKIRNDFFNYLNSNYKKVCSYGKLFNNVEKIYNHCWFDDEQIELISRHKFALCFENSRDDNDYYITEKILNVKLSGAIPIYWGTNKCLELFESNSFLFLEGNTIKDFETLLNKIKNLDNNDEEYLKMKRNRLILPEKIKNLRSTYLRTIIQI